MSSTEQRYYCHQCDRDVAIAAPASPDDEVFCPLCAGGFVEELLDDDQPPNPSTPHHHQMPQPPFFPFSSFLDLRNPSDLAGVLGPPSPSAPRAASAATNNNQFDVTDFLHGHLGGLLSGGATIQIVLEGSSFPAGFASFPAAAGVSLGDYFMGSGLEQLIQQLAENDPSRYGTPPAAKAAVAALPDVAVSADMMAADGGAQCAVCMDDFLLGAAAKQLPCNHVFHKDCILPWLDLHSSCPVCRHEMPTDDPDYETHQRQAQAAAPAPAAAAAAPASPGGGPSPRVMERRFRISLPWPLRAAFAAQQAESSDQDAADYNNDPNASGRSYDDLD
ncbi:E3 ubiquitin-protein ligase RING1-like [Hordeum vulgare]|nr:E3 ubiquitin-protein ligase RING1-like [Hordeum vulgare]